MTNNLFERRSARLSMTCLKHHCGMNANLAPTPIEPEDADDFTAQLAALGAEYHRRGWTPGTGGNFSVVLSREPLRLLVTVSGVPKGTLEESDFVEVNAQGATRGRPGAQPSAETAIHLVLARFGGAGAVLHTHSVPATVLSLDHPDGGWVEFRGLEMVKALAGIETPATKARLRVLPNSQDMAALAVDVRDALESSDPIRWGFLLAGHGLYAWGHDLAEANRHLEALEFLLEVTERRDARAAASHPI